MKEKISSFFRFKERGTNFRVETIDAFFQSVVKNLAHELNLNANLKVDLNDGEVLNAAVDRIMERLHLTPVILNWVLEYVEDRIANDQRWDIAKEVKGFASWIFKEAYLTHEQELRNVLNENQKIAELRKTLNQILQESEDIIQSAVGNFRDELEQRGLTCATFSRGSTLDTYLKRLAGGLFEAEFGDLFFALVNAARLYGVDPESALARTNNKFMQRFNYMEEHAAAEGRMLHDMTLDEMESLWQEAKGIEH